MARVTYDSEEVIQEVALPLCLREQILCKRVICSSRWEKAGSLGARASSLGARIGQ